MPSDRPHRSPGLGDSEHFAECPRSALIERSPQAAHIGTYALAGGRMRAAHIAGYALPVFWFLRLVERIDADGASFLVVRSGGLFTLSVSGVEGSCG